ncbi:MAG: S1 RNA-binding domain-containing protein, partial [Candidatus Omnitrophota bacterium]
IPARLKLAEFYAQLGSSPDNAGKTEHIARAIEHYRSILAEDPADRTAIENLGMLYSAMKEFDKAEILYRKNKDITPENAVFHLRLALNYLSQKMPDKALDELRAATQCDPGHGGAFLLTATVHTVKNGIPEAIAAAAKAAEIFRKNNNPGQEARARHQLGLLYLRAGLPFDAIQQFKTIIETWPDAVDVNIELAQLYSVLNLPDRAISIILNSSLNPGVWELAISSGTQPLDDARKVRVCNILGQSYLRGRDLVNALKYFRIAKTLGFRYKPGFLDNLENAVKSAWGTAASLYSPGDRVKGTITGITDRAITIKLENALEGNVQASEISWMERNPRLTEMFKKGDEISAVVLNIDSEKQKIELGIKQLSSDPWENIEQHYSVGTRIKGKISDMTDSSAILELEDGVEGIIQASDISWDKKINYPSDLLKRGQRIEAVVLEIDKNNRKILLGMKQLEKDPWDDIDEFFKAGGHVKGTVDSVAGYAAIVQLNHDVKGYINIAEMSWTRTIHHPAEVFEPGQEVEAVILKVDKGSRKIYLGIKQLSPDPWPAIKENYKTGTKHRAEVLSVREFSITVKLEKDLEGSIRVSDLGMESAEDIKSGLRPGDTIEVEIINVDEQKRTIFLTLPSSAADEKLQDQQ